MDIGDLIASLEADPASWPLRLEIIDQLVRNGEVDRAKSFVRSAPDDAPMPPDYPVLIHTLLTKGPEAFEPQPEPAPEQEPPSTEPPLEESPKSIEINTFQLVETAPTLLPVKKLPPPAELNITPPTSEAASLDLVEHEAVESRPLTISGGDKAGALAVAILAHILVGGFLVYTKIYQPASAPPMISVSHAANSDESSLTKESLSRSADKAASSSMASSPLFQAKEYSDFALPDTLGMISDMPMMSLDEIGRGFGSASIGAGDVAYRGAIPEQMRARCSFTERINRIEQSGGDIHCELAVVDGLHYLMSIQNKDTGQVGRSYPAAMTGFTLLAYLGHCETPDSVVFGDAVVKSALYLIETAVKNKGIISKTDTGNHVSYEHAIATYALAELFTIVRAGGQEIPRLKPVLNKAAEKIVQDQSGRGGWGYSAGQADDMSVSGWNIQALKAIYNTGLDIPGVKSALDKAVVRYLPSIQDDRGAFRYRPGNGNGKNTLTGAALLGMQIWGKMRSDPYKKGFKHLQTAYRDPFADGYYALYYNTQVFFLHGGLPWEIYNKSFKDKLIDAQKDDGSWPGAGSHGGADRKIMTTAWAILMLEVYYRYLPTTDKVGDLRRG